MPSHPPTMPVYLPVPPARVCFVTTVPGVSPVLDEVVVNNLSPERSMVLAHPSFAFQHTLYNASTADAAHRHTVGKARFFFRQGPSYGFIGILREVLSHRNLMLPYRVENCRERDAAFLRQRRLSDSGTGGRQRGKCEQANRERRFHVPSPLLSALKLVADAFTFICSKSRKGPPRWLGWQDWTRSLWKQSVCGMAAAFHPRAQLPLSRQCAFPSGRRGGRPDPGRPPSSALE